MKLEKDYRNEQGCLDIKIKILRNSTSNDNVVFKITFPKQKTKIDQFQPDNIIIPFMSCCAKAKRY